MREGRRRGFTLLELVVVLAIFGALLAAAVPGLERWFEDQRLKSAARGVGDSLSLARTEALRTGSVHIVFFQTDALGNLLTDADGDPVPMLVLNDGAPGSAGQDCQIGAGEPTRTFPAEPDVSWGVSAATAAAPEDAGAGAIGDGSSFLEPDGDDASWVLFRPDGTPRAFGIDSGTCTVGDLGSGGGGLYLTNGRRDYAVVLAPLGGVSVNAWDVTRNAWRD